MASAKLQIYLSGFDGSNSTTVGYRLRIFIPDPVEKDHYLLNTMGFFLLNEGGTMLLAEQSSESITPSGVDTNVFVYEVIENGNTSISVFIGIASPEDMTSIPIDEPSIQIVGKKFRRKEIDLLFRSKTHCESTIKLVGEDINHLFRLKASMEALPSGGSIEVIS